MLYFHSSDNVEIKAGKIKNGILYVAGNEYKVDKLQEPLLIKWPNTWFGFIRKHVEKFYFIYYNNPAPLRYDMEDECFKPEVTIENLTAVAKNNLVKQLLTLSIAKQEFMMWMIIGGVMGLLAGILISPMIGIGLL